MKGINQATNPCIQSSSDQPQLWKRTSKEKPTLLQELETNTKTTRQRQNPNILISNSQYFGSGPALIWLSWIRIRIANADLDTEARTFTQFKSKYDFKPFKMTFVPTELRYVLSHITYI